MNRSIRLERVYPVGPERVFRALTDRDALSAWLMPNDFVPELGRSFTFRSKPQGSWDGVTHCTITELDPPRRLAYSWSGQRKDGTGPALARTVVTWTLVPEGSGTRLVLEHTGFEGWGEVVVSLMMQMGWWSKLRAKLPLHFGAALAA